MEVVIVNCFDTYEDRIDLLHEFFKNKGHNVTIIQSDFRHFKKVHREDVKSNFLFIKSKPYYKNMSVARLVSHHSFAKDAFKIVETMKPDLLYVMVPPNSLTKFAAKYKQQNESVKLVFDLIDLWPETMPVGKIKNLPPFTFWKLMRDNNLIYADNIITECDLYQEVLKDVLNGKKTDTVYLAKRQDKQMSNPQLDMNQINFCYLGSINNIIDISKIELIIKLSQKIKPTTLHIIGDGENRDILLNVVKNTGATVKYHGEIYDSHQKQQIFDACHFGLNVMKNSVCVGLTMKSIDYFQAGLPIFNTIIGDTDRIVKEHKIGFNLTEENMYEVIANIKDLDIIELLEMRSNTQKVYDNYFSVKAFNEKMSNVIKID